jgi:hypothetical protein
MAKRTNEQSLKEAIDQMLKSFHLDDKMKELQVVSSWEKVMGKTVSNRTTKIFMNGSKLFIYLNSASLREELLHQREKIIARLNTEAGSEVVEEIIFS